MQHSERTDDDRADRYNEAGVTLIELLVVILIIGLLAAVIAPRVLGTTDTARLSKVQQDLTRLEDALALYCEQNGACPGSDIGLEALVDGGLISRLQKDPWKNDYVYEYAGGTQFRVYSLGADGQPGGEGMNADLDLDSFVG